MSGRSMPPERTIETLHKHALRVKIIRKLKLQTPDVSAWFGLGSFGGLGFFIIADSFVCLSHRFWSVTGCTASQAGSWLLYRCPRSYSPGHQAIQGSCSGQLGPCVVALHKYLHSKGRFTHPYHQQCSIRPFPTVNTRSADKSILIYHSTTGHCLKGFTASFEGRRERTWTNRGRTNGDQRWPQ